MNFSVTQANYTIEANLTVIGQDLLIEITGGNVPHIGTVTTLTKSEKITTNRFPSHDGRYHKDGVLAEAVAKIIQPQLPGSCTITSGVHVDKISLEQIKASKPMSENLGRQISQWLQKTTLDSHQPVYYGKNETPK